MIIGEELAAARHRAGLTVREVSEGTRIRESILRGIEQDDYSGCGGDFYARGHIRAIAQAVGTDPRPLIEQYDASVRAQQVAAPTVLTAAAPVRMRERRGINWTAVLTVLVLIALGLAGYLFVAGAGHRASGGAPAGTSQHRRSGAPAGLEPRAGEVPSLVGLPVVASAPNARGVITLPLARSVQARYLLVWFTKLAPDPAGTFLASIDNIKITG